MNVVGLVKIVTWLCDIYLSLLICFGNYDMFLIMQINLNCISCQRTSNDDSEEEPEASWVKDTMAKERDSEKYKENGRSTSRDEEGKAYIQHEKGLAL